MDGTDRNGHEKQNRTDLDRGRGGCLITGLHLGGSHRTPRMTSDAGTQHLLPPPLPPAPNDIRGGTVRGPPWRTGSAKGRGCWRLGSLDFTRPHRGARRARQALSIAVRCHALSCALRALAVRHALLYWTGPCAPPPSPRRPAERAYWMGCAERADELWPAQAGRLNSCCGGKGGGGRPLFAAAGAPPPPWLALSSLTLFAPPPPSRPPPRSLSSLPPSLPSPVSPLL